MQNLPSQVEIVIASLNRLKGDIEQLQSDNKKLNDDLLVLEKSRDEAYKSFNTETHILVSREELKELKYEIEEASSCANNAYEEARSSESCLEDAKSSASYASDSCVNAEEKIRDIIKKGEVDGEE
jgi:hypothetical protein